jgi:hypothetical protein
MDPFGLNFLRHRQVSSRLLHSVDVLAHAGSFYGIRVRLLGSAASARRKAAHSPHFCPSDAFAIWSTIPRTSLSAAGRMNDWNGHEQQEADDNGAHRLILADG